MKKENTGVTTSHIPIVGKLLRDMLNAPGLAKDGKHNVTEKKLEGQAKCSTC